jgi:murein L,D-transpeptidase YafK
MILRRVFLMMFLSSLSACGQGALPESERLQEVRERVKPALERDLKKNGLALGAPIYLRIFKESAELEVWLKGAKEDVFTLYKTYPISTWGSGTLGPKLAEGDGQAPEGVYTVKAGQLNPRSQYHLAFNLGYPNAFDRAHGRTGSALMVHGSTVSIGCYAMTDAGIEPIYLMVEAALKNGAEAVRVDCYPFRHTDERLSRETKSPWHSFWTDLGKIQTAFAKKKRPPTIEIADKRYLVK